MLLVGLYCSNLLHTAATSRPNVSLLVCNNDQNTQVASPLSLLLSCLGLDRWRDRNANNLLPGNPSSRPPPLTRGWAGALRRRGYYEGEEAEGAGGEFLELQQGGAGSGSARVATLGERGRRSAFDQFRRLQRDGACCDVSLAVGGRTFKAHK